MADSLASQIITAIGGPENVRSLTHCATRLRFELADASKVDQNALEHMKGVLGAVPQSGDRFQVVIGGGVATVYENIMHLPEMANAGAASASGEGQKSNADVKAEARSKARGKVAWLDSFFEYLADSFRPILGVLLGASIIIALVNLLISLNVIPNDEASAGWVFVKAIWKGVFYFLPIMVAYNASKKLKGRSVAGRRHHGHPHDPAVHQPDGRQDHHVRGERGSGHQVLHRQHLRHSDGVERLQWQRVRAAAHGRRARPRLPRIEEDHSRKRPAGVRAVLLHDHRRRADRLHHRPDRRVGRQRPRRRPGLMNTHAPFIFAIIIPLLYPFLVPLGLHWPLNALMLANIQTLGYDFIQGPMGVWNFACFGATAGVLFIAVRDKDKDMRQTALGALAAGLLGGVSEPSLYGIHLRYKLVYKRMLVGCGLGGVVIAVLGWLFRPSPPPARPCMV